MDNHTPKGQVAILAGLDADLFDKAQNASDASLDELEALLETAGGVCAAKVLQHRDKPDAHSFLGEGKALEIRDLVRTTGADLVILDNELTPSQIKALEELTGAAVMDRGALILDIFAQRAKTKEGRLQVELAQYQYYLPRLTVWNETMGRLGGGIGTRGPGETQLETDRRHIRARISRLQAELKEVRQNRATARQKRMKNKQPVVALVGYTNAGKSSLLNALTGAGIPANDRLFDTLDTTTRRLQVSDTLQVLLSDTVGFISKLPHHLVAAFRATLEELEYADLLLHVIDATDEEQSDHIAVVDELITQLAGEAVPVIRVYNKTDLVPGFEPPREGTSLAVSARTGEGLEDLLGAIRTQLDADRRQVRFLLPWDKAGELDRLHAQATVLASEYLDRGILVTAVCDPMTYGRLRDYVYQEVEP